MTANLGMADTLLLMVLALVVFGPRRLPQIGRQIGKLMYEFRKASNDFKFQMEEELRQSEEADRRKKEEEARQKALAAAPPAPQVQPPAETAADTPVTPSLPATAEATTEGPYSGETTNPDLAPEAPRPVETIEDLTAAAAENPVPGNRGTQPEGETARTEDLMASAVEAARLRIQPPSTGEVVAANPPGRVPQQAELFGSPEEPAAQPAPATAPQSAAPDAASDAPSDTPSDADRSEPAAHHG